MGLQNGQDAFGLSITTLPVTANADADFSQHPADRQGEVFQIRHPSDQV
jgi:hypothetical protein